MKKLLLQTTAILLILAGVIACGKEEKIGEHSIIGRWKLMEVVHISGNDYYVRDTIDYSNNNIIYDFHSDNKLIIQGYIENDLQQGEHIYNYTQLNVCPTCLPAPNLVIDNDSRVFCKIEVHDATIKMSIGGEAIIGESQRIKNFIRI
ncbi:MAG: hypothetical protein LBP63_00345 [Prevotellaceae bacterium]|jgi:hypothetical protein|nr:hypothetical protein [Prevotellaceae bacterium]